MSKSWIKAKKNEFVRNMMREFCLATQALEEQFRFFDRYGRCRFDVIRDLLGEEMNKGLLWRLKDTAHHVFRNENGERLVGQFLDWGMGYIFHETIKLKEDAYQQENYGPWFREMQSQELPAEEALICQELYQVVLQTRESMNREIKRIRFILFHCRRLFPVYLQHHRDNSLLARFLFEHNDLIRQVFEAHYEQLIDSIYGSDPALLYLLASRSLRQGGWAQEAREAVAEAVKLAPSDQRVLQEKEIVDNQVVSLKV